MKPNVGRSRLAHLFMSGKKVFWYALIVFVFLFSMKLAAFDPDSAIYGHSSITRAIATDGFKYHGKTVPEFTASLTIAPDTPLRFSPESADQLVLGVRSMDFLGFNFQGAGTNGNFLSEEIPGGLLVEGESSNPDSHCDDARIVECSNRIYDFTIKPEGDVPNLASNNGRLLTYSVIQLLRKRNTGSGLSLMHKTKVQNNSQKDLPL